MSSSPISLAGKFGLTKIKCVPIQQGVYRLISRRKQYCLKRMPVSEQHLLWIDKSLISLRKRGFHAFSWRDPSTKEGRRVFVTARPGGERFILTPWIKGRWVSPLSTRDMRNCGIVLARFQRYGSRKSFKSPSSVNQFGKWRLMFRDKQGYISTFVRKYGKQTGIHNWSLKVNDYAQKATKLLQQAKYQQLLHSHRHLIAVCHGDGGPTNFIRNRRGLHLIDFESMCVDFRVYDLYKIIYNCCKDHNWNFAIARKILDGYSTINPLERADYALLKSLLRFPQTSYLTASALLLKPYSQSFIKKEISRALSTERKLTIFIRKVDRYALKVCKL